MRRTSHCLTHPFCVALLLGALAAQAAPAQGPRTAAVPAMVRWHVRGSGIGTQAVWRAADGRGLRVQCEFGEPRLLLRIDDATLVSGLQQVSLIADGIGMEYPLERGTTGYVSKIALDAPILDRMLVARSFSLYGGGHMVNTGVPGDALARVVRACRALHWPRDARIDPSDAGFAKK